MGLFDIFKSSKERKTFETLHGMNLLMLPIKDFLLQKKGKHIQLIDFKPI